MTFASPRVSLPWLLVALVAFGCSLPAVHAVESEKHAGHVRREVAFVDAGIEDYRSLLAGFAPATQVFVLDPAEALETQLATWLERVGPVDTIHFLSHGAPGAVRFGVGEVGLRELRERAASWKEIGRSLRPGADVLLYGCRIGAGPAGQQFVETLAELIGADVAASSNLTGAASAGGDWRLEVTHGAIDPSHAFDGATTPFDSVLGPAPGTIVFSNRGRIAGPAHDPFVLNLNDLGLDVLVETESGTGAQIYETDTGGDHTAISEPGDASLQIYGLGGSKLSEIRFVSTDGAFFQIDRLMAGVTVAATLTFTGWRNGNQVATTTSDMSTGLDGNGNKTITFGSDWESIDEIRVNPSPLVWPMGVSFDDLVIATAVNVAPSALTLSGASINESAASPGTTLGTLTTVDDPTDSYTYALVAGEGDTHNSSFAIDGTALKIGGGALATGDYSIRLRTTDGGGLFYEKVLAITVVGPRVTAVHAITTAATYDVGASFLVRVAFSRPVNVTGTPTLTLETGATDRTIPYESSSGAHLFFRYTVQEGDTSPDLDYTSTTALALNGGTIRDADENDALLTLPAPGTAGSLSANAAVVVGDSLPTAISRTLAPIHPSVAVNGSTIATFSTTNPDASDTHTYALVAGEGDTHNGLFAIDGDTLVLAGSSLAIGDYSIRVQSTDRNGNSVQRAFALSINIVIPEGSWFDRDDPSHEFPTTTGKLSMGLWRHPIGERGPGLYTIEFEITGTGYWPQQEGYAFGVIGLPAFQTSFHELGQFTHEWAFRGRDGRSYGEGVALPFGSVFKNLGDRIRLELNTVTGELRVYTKRGTGDYILEGGKALFTEVSAPNKMLYFAVSGVAWQPASVLVISETFPNSAPTDAALSASSIAQSAATSGAAIGTLSTTDSDADDTHTYAFASGDGDGNNASFALDGATLKIGDSALGVGSYSVRIRTTDPEDGVFEKVFSITVADDVAPRIESLVRHTPASSPTAADALVWRITFSEAVVDLDAADFAVTGTTATVSEVASAGGHAFDVTVSGGDLADLNGSVTLAFAASPTVADAAGNGLVNTTPTGTNEATFVVSNNAAPTELVLSHASINQSVAAANAVIGTLATTDPDTDDTHTYALAAGEGDADNASFVLDGATLKLGASALAPAEYAVRIRTTDTAGAWREQSFSVVVVDDIVPGAPSPPDLATASDSGSSATDDHTRITTPVFTGTAETGSTVTLFAGATIIGTGPATEGAWSITSTALAAGPHDITATATDAAGNTSAASAVLAITIETTAPTVVIGAPSSTLTRTGPVTFTVTYADANLVSTTLAVDDITLNQTGSAHGMLTVSGSGDSYTVTLSDITGDGALGFAIEAGTASDLAGNQAAAATSPTFEVDNTAPAIAAIVRQTPETVHTAASSIVWLVNFDEAVSGVDVGDFVLTAITDEASGTISAVNALDHDASAYEVIVDPVAGQGQLRLDLTAASAGIADLAGNPIADGGFTDGEFYFVGATSVFDGSNLPDTATEVDASHTNGFKPAQRFTTAAVEPLTLSSMVAWLTQVDAEATPVVRIYTDQAGAPGEAVGTLTNPPNLTANALNVWTGSVTLNPSTTYWIVFEETVSSFAIGYTEQTAGGTGAWLTSLDYELREGLHSSAPVSGVMRIGLGATSVPTISSSLTANGTYRTAFAYNTTATNTPTSFAATGLPNGLTIDPATGVISGASTQTGAFNVSLTATNTSGPGVPRTLVLTIGKATLTVTADSQSRSYGGGNHPLTVSYSGFLGSDHAGSLTTQPTATTAATAASPVGTYAITASGGVSDGYAFTYVPGVLTVTTAPQTINFPTPADLLLGQSATLSATASSGLPVSFSVISGPATVSGATLSTTGVGPVTVRASQGGNENYDTAPNADRSFNVLVGQPTVTTPEQVPTPPVGGTAQLVVTESNPNLDYQWQRNGSNLPNGAGSSLTITDIQPTTAGLYTYTATVPGGSGGTSEPVIVGLTTDEKIVGTGDLVGSDIVHPNGNVYDQVLLEGPGAAVTASTNKVTRLSFVDLTNDIVQVEFSGAGTLSVVMDDPSQPAPPINYNQENVDYVRGHVGLVITGANETSNLSVFSVGPVTAVNSALFKEGVTYDGVADVAFVAIQSANGKFGGIRTGNVSYYASQGFTGVYAPGVEFAGPINIGEVTAFDSATPVLVFGNAGTVNITGGNLEQDNGSPVTVSGITQVQFVDGQTSQGVTLPAQPNQGVLTESGVNVTSQIVVNP